MTEGNHSTPSFYGEVLAPMFEIRIAHIEVRHYPDNALVRYTPEKFLSGMDLLLLQKQFHPTMPYDPIHSDNWPQATSDRRQTVVYTAIAKIPVWGIGGRKCVLEWPQGMLLHDQASNPTVNQIPSNAKEVGELASVTLNTQVAGNKYTLQRLPVKPRDRLYPVLIPLKAFDSVSVGILMDLHERGRLPGTQVCLQDFVDAYRRRSQYRASVQ